MQIVTDESMEVFLREAGPLLYTHEVVNSLMLGLCETVVAMPESFKEPILLRRLVQEGRTLTASIQLPPQNIVMTYATKSEIESFAQHLHQMNVPVPGVVGPAEVIETFIQIWTQLTGKPFRLGMATRIYKLEKVIMPSVPGSMRLARPDEADLAAQWMMDFAEESLPPEEHQRFEQRLGNLQRNIEKKMIFLWTIDDVPVSLAQRTRPTKNSATVNTVYTPKDLRKKGYASALVAHLSQKILDDGKKFCVLYTDLANPTSNKIYQNVGYQAVEDSRFYLFEGT